MTTNRTTLKHDVKVIVFKRDGCRCHYCGRKTTKANRHYDHVVPVAHGGTDDPANLVVACKQCNTRKGKRDYAEFIESEIARVQVQLETLMKRSHGSATGS